MSIERTHYIPELLPPVTPRRLTRKRAWMLDPFCYLAYLSSEGTKWREHVSGTYPGTLSGAVYKSSTRGDNCVYFDGANDQVTTTLIDQSYRGANKDFSICFWMNHNFQVATGYDRLVTKYTGVGAACEFAFDQNAALNKIWFQVYDTVAAATKKVDSFALTPGVWYHVCGTCSGSLLTLYINGISQGSIAYTTQLTNAQKLCIGYIDTGVSATYYNGLLDELFIFKRCLAAWEAAAMYEEGRS